MLNKANGPLGNAEQRHESHLSNSSGQPSLDLSHSLWSQYRLTPITCLRPTTCPATIPRFVITVVVNAVKCHTVRTSAHIQKECLKRTPSFTDSDASTAVTRVCCSERIQTPLSHREPRSICCAWFTGVAVCRHLVTILSQRTSSASFACCQTTPFPSIRSR